MASQPHALLSNAQIDDLVNVAASNGRRRMHRNIHATFEDKCQRFFNAIFRDSYIPPHRHSGKMDDETLVAIRGSFMAILFDDRGEIQCVVCCGDDQEHVGVVVPVGQWHSVVALSEPAVLLEIKAGPFDPVRAKEFAPWAPAEGAHTAGDYRAKLAGQAAEWLHTTAHL